MGDTERGTNKSTSGNTTFIAFDPGGRTGWSIFQVRTAAFTSSKGIIRNIVAHQHGEFSGTENGQVAAAVTMVKQRMPFRVVYPDELTNFYVITEDFIPLGKIGGKELLGPVRINAALDYALWRNNIKLHYQMPQMRLSITKDRLKRWGIGPIKGKDAFASVQHVITFMRRLKEGTVE